MAKGAAIATKATSKAQPNTPAKAPAPPPAHESRIVNGVIERYVNGTLVSTTPPPTPKTTPAKTHAKLPTAKATPAKAAPPTLATAVKAAVSAKQKVVYVGRLGSDDIWAFEPADPTHEQGTVLVRHYAGYEQRGKTVTKRWREAERLFDDMLTKSGFTWIDGVTHRLVDEAE